MKKISLAVLGIFLGISNVQALTWTGAEDLSSINAQIIDTGTTDYVLSPIDPLNPIDGTGVQINGASMGLVNSFVFPLDDGTNPYSMNGASADYTGLLDFNAVETNSATLLGDVINTDDRGYGVYIHANSVVHNALTISGTVSALYDGIYMHESSAGSFISTADVTGDRYGIYLHSNTAIAGAVDISGTVNSRLTGVNVYSNISAGSFTSSADITSTNGSGISLNVATITGAVDISGTIDSLTQGVYMNNSSAASFTSTADITASNNVGVYLNSATIAGAVNISGTISGTTGVQMSNGSADSFTSVASSNSSGTSLSGATIAGAIDISGAISNISISSISADSVVLSANNIVGTSGISLSGTITNAVDISGTINSSTNGIFSSGSADSFTSTADVTADNYGMYLHNLAITGAINISGAINSVSNGLNISGTSSFGGGIINNGSITSTTAAAIAGNTGNNTFNYSGTGELSGATYDIDMGTGTDTLNIVNAELIELSINSAETIDISASTLTLSITDLNKANQIITTTGVTSLSLTNVIFDFDSTAAIITGGTDLFLMESTLIDPANLGTLTANLSGAAFDGAFSIVDNGGIDELHFIAAAAAAPPLAASSFVSSSVVAAQVSNAADNQVMGRMAEGRLQKKRAEFAALYSDSMFDIYEQPRDQVWMQAFGLSGTYEGEVEKGLDGYDTTLGGIVAGYDYNWGLIRTGIAGTYSTGQVEGDGNAFEIDVESFSGSLYGVMDFSKIYIEAAASYGATTFDQNMGGSVSSYDSENMGALLRVGMKLHAGAFGLEPFAGFQYKNVIVEEHSNGIDNIAEYNQEMVKAEVGFTTSYQMMLASGDVIVPYLRLETGHDFSDDATLTSLDNSGAVIGNPANVNLGNWVSRAATGVSFLTRDNYSISGEYEYEFRDKYEAHIGKIKGRLMF